MKNHQAAKSSRSFDLPLYDLYHGKNLLEGNLHLVWPVSLNAAKGDFALLVEPLSQPPLPAVRLRNPGT